MLHKLKAYCGGLYAYGIEATTSCHKFCQKSMAGFMAFCAVKDYVWDEIEDIFAHKKDKIYSCDKAIELKICDKII